MKVPLQIEKIKKLMKNEINILIVYENIKELEKQKRHYYESKSEDELNIISIINNQIKNIVESFDQWLFGIYENVLNYIENKPFVIIKIIQVIERNEILEELYENGKRKRNYKIEFFQILKFWIIKHFNKLNDLNDTKDFIKLANQYLIELETIVDLSPKLFPESYKFSEFWSNEYIKNFYTSLLNNYTLKIKEDLTSELSAKEVISIIEWININYKSQISRLFIKNQEIKLMEAIDPLYDFYCGFIQDQSTNWIKNIIETDLNGELIIIDECYYTLSRTLLFDILNEQFNNVKRTKEKKFIFDVMSELAPSISLYQNSICNILHSKCESDNLQWIIAQINNNSKIYDEFIEFMDRIYKVLISPFDEKLKTLFDKVQDGFLRIINEAIKSITKIIYKDIENDLKKTYNLKSNHANIIATLDDYFGDLYQHLTRDYFSKTILNIIDSITESYIEELFKTKDLKLTNELCQRLIEDYKSYIELFEKYINDKKLTILKQKFSILSYIINFLDAEAYFVSIPFSCILKSFPDFPLDLIDSFISNLNHLLLLNNLDMKIEWNKEEKNIAKESIMKSFESFHKKNTNIQIISPVFERIKKEKNTKYSFFRRIKN